MSKQSRLHRADLRAVDRRRRGAPFKPSKVSRSYARWIKSFRTMVVYDDFGYPYYATNRETLIKNGGKP